MQRDAATPRPPHRGPTGDPPHLAASPTPLGHSRGAWGSGSEISWGLRSFVVIFGNIYIIIYIYINQWKQLHDKMWTTTCQEWIYTSNCNHYCIWTAFGKPFILRNRPRQPHIEFCPSFAGRNLARSVRTFRHFYIFWTFSIPRFNDILLPRELQRGRNKQKHPACTLPSFRHAHCKWITTANQDIQNLQWFTSIYERLWKP